MDERRWIAVIIAVSLVAWGIVKFIISWREYYPKEKNEKK